MFKGFGGGRYFLLACQNNLCSGLFSFISSHCSFGFLLLMFFLMNGATFLVIMLLVRSVH